MDQIVVVAKTGADRTTHWGILVAVDQKTYIVQFREGMVEFPLMTGWKVYRRPGGVGKKTERILVKAGWRAKKGND